MATAGENFHVELQGKIGANEMNATSQSINHAISNLRSSLGLMTLLTIIMQHLLSKK